MISHVAVRVRLVIIGCVCSFVPCSGYAADSIQPTPPEHRTAQEWIESHLTDCILDRSSSDTVMSQPKSLTPGLYVYANHDPVTLNARGDSPLKIGERTFARGLYCHAVSRILVCLPGKGNRFSALVGLDHNEDTARGKGSVIFSVAIGDKTVYESGVLRYGTPASKVDVDLGGANSFTLNIADAGDGIGWDQSVWAEAKVTLADGRVLWLGDMPLHDCRVEASQPPIDRSSQLAFSFVYAGRSSDSLLAEWPREISAEKLDDVRTRRVLTWTDPKTGLEVRCEAMEYADYPAIEWTVYFKSGGTQPTPIIENIQALDATFKRTTDGEFVLNFWKGDTCAPDLYEPSTDTLEPNAEKHFAPADGRGTNRAFPYYNLRSPGGGVLLAVGWPGQWATSFRRDAENGLRIRAGQQRTHLVLKPGEEIRTPLIAMVFWKGDDMVRAQNLWRRWMWAHNVPRTSDGKLPPAILFGNTSAEFYEMIHANEENQKYFIDRYIEEKIPIDYWWMDAGWYPCDGQWPKTGTWEPDTSRFPNGLRAISDHALERGVKTLVWFEPERVGGGWLGGNHPEWRLGPLLNLGNREAWHWLVNHIDGQIKSQGIHLYRQDFNMSPLDFWRGNDAPDRQGITENLHVQGYLAYWDELKRRNPQLIIDSCASGGRRNDPETMRRAVPLHPTDFDYGNLTVKQAFHYSLYQWIPYFGSNTVPIDSPDPYAIRSGQSLSTTYGYDVRRKDLDYDELRRLTSQLKQTVAYYRGDFYPLTPYNRSDEEWIAWQFHDPDKDAGIVQAFRRPRNETSGKTFRLRGLDPEANYQVRDLDGDSPISIGGRELIEKGVSISIPDRPGAVIVEYIRTEQ